MYTLCIYIVWPKVCGHLPPTPICAHSKTMDINPEMSPLGCCNSLHPSRKAVHYILECRCENLRSIGH